jgi:hypothetical protein
VFRQEVESEGTAGTAEQLYATLTRPVALLDPSSGKEGLKAHDIVRLTRELNGVPSGSEGVVLGWYTNQPDRVVVRLDWGEVENLPRDSLELVEVEAAA